MVPTSSPSSAVEASTPAAVAGTISPTIPDQTPSPADFTAAKKAVETYTAELVSGEYAKAWAMLAPESQAHWQTLAAFAKERAAFFKTVTAGYIVSADAPTGSGQPIPDYNYSIYGAAIDLRHAILVDVDYPDSNGSHTGRTDGYIVSPAAGRLEIFDVPKILNK